MVGWFVGRIPQTNYWMDLHETRMVDGSKFRIDPIYILVRTWREGQIIFVFSFRCLQGIFRHFSGSNALVYHLFIYLFIICFLQCNMMLILINLSSCKPHKLSAGWNKQHTVFTREGQILLSQWLSLEQHQYNVSCGFGRSFKRDPDDVICLSLREIITRLFKREYMN